MMDLDKLISSTVKSGKAFFGSKQTLNAAKSGRAIALVVSSNCPTNIVVGIQQYSDLSKIPLYVYKDSSLDLGAACGKPFAVSAMAIRENNDSEILQMIRETRMASEE